MDAAVVCIGTVMSNSILSVLNLADIGVRHVYAKALSEPHGRILLKVGATEVLYPEKDTAITLAERLNNPNMLEYLPFIEGYSISKFEPPERFPCHPQRPLRTGGQGRAHRADARGGAGEVGEGGIAGGTKYITHSSTLMNPIWLK